MNTSQILQNQFGDKIKKDKEITKLITLRLKAVSEYFFEPTSLEEWVEVINLADRHNIPIFILGGGSNVAVYKNYIPGITIRNRYIFKKIIFESEEFVDYQISSGYIINQLIRETTREGLSGFEYHLGLPGTLGGAIYMNSKWTKPISYIGENLLIGKILDRDGVVREEPRDYFEFEYDYSKLQKTGEIFLEGIFRLTRHDAAELVKRSEESLKYRKTTQPFGEFTGGCFFQNITEAQKEKYKLKSTSAGYLIDKVGFKGKIIGGVKVSEKHANFIVNTGNAEPEDLKKMIDTIRSAVKEKFGVTLKEEVNIINK